MLYIYVLNTYLAKKFLNLAADLRPLLVDLLVFTVLEETFRIVERG